MTPKEFRASVADSDFVDQLNGLNASIHLLHYGYSQSFEGITTMYEFFYNQVKGWANYGDNLPPLLKESITHFTTVKELLKKVINRQGFDGSIWQHANTAIGSHNKRIFTFDSAEAIFLVDLYKSHPNYFHGAFYFLTKEFSYVTQSMDSFIGTLLAYEFRFKESSEIVQRRNREKGSLTKLKNEVSEYISTAETTLVEHLRGASDQVDQYRQEFQDTKTESENKFNTWYADSKNQFDEFTNASRAEMDDLRSTYEELLRLQKPADYWNKRADKLKKEGWRAVAWLSGLVVFGCLTLYALLWLTPEGMLLSFIKGQASAIKWSVIYVTFISFLAYGIRVVHKVAFSSFHLARDAEEREQLTYVYLAMIKDSAVDEKDRSLIMQSLFSRADTGLLKEDSSPSMPGQMLGSLIK